MVVWTHSDPAIPANSCAFLPQQRREAPILIVRCAMWRLAQQHTACLGCWYDMTNAFASVNTAEPRTKILRFWSLSQEDLIYCAWICGKSTRVKSDPARFESSWILKLIAWIRGFLGSWRLLKYVQEYVRT